MISKIETQISINETGFGSFSLPFPLYHPENCSLFLYKTKSNNSMAIEPSHEYLSVTALMV